MVVNTMAEGKRREDGKEFVTTPHERASASHTVCMGTVRLAAVMEPSCWHRCMIGTPIICRNVLWPPDQQSPDSAIHGHNCTITGVGRVTSSVL